MNVTRDIKNNLKPLLRLLLVMSFPWAFVLIVGWFIMPYTLAYLKEIIAFGFLTAIFTGSIVSFRNNRVRHILATTLLLILFLLAFIKLSFYMIYGVKISASALFVIFETNGNEASDFLANYFELNVIGLAGLLLVAFFLAVFILKHSRLEKLQVAAPLKILTVLVIVGSAYGIFKKLKDENIILTSLYSYQDYNSAKAYAKETLAKKDTHNISNVQASNTQQTYVVIIGESTSKWHMQLYGYARETNPLLSEIKEELVVFDSVITPNVHTIIALDKILTLSDFKEPNKKINASIVQLANKAGFDTFWISNQKPVGLHESVATIIGSAAKHKSFISTEEAKYDIYDEALFPYLEKALNATSKKKIIFLHLIGTHSRYNRRYPSTFNVFKDETATAYKHEKSKKLINEYDNAVLYNDFIVREVIEAVRKRNENSYVVYFSDHGDEVYDTMDFVGHNEYRGTRPMFEIPFIAWFSDKYKTANPSVFTIENLRSRPYNLEDFIHSFSEISTISFDSFNAEKSIFNVDFKRKKRIIKKGEDYDKR